MAEELATDSYATVATQRLFRLSFHTAAATTYVPSSSTLLSCAASSRFLPISASTVCSVPSASTYVMGTVSAGRMPGSNESKSEFKNVKTIE
jgi:hypothetical protein